MGDGYAADRIKPPKSKDKLTVGRCFRDKPPWVFGRFNVKKFVFPLAWDSYASIRPCLPRAGGRE